GGHIILVAETAKNPDYEERLKKMYENFKLQHERFQLDHKIVFLKSTEEIGKSNDYIALIQYLENRMNDQDLKYVDENDFKAYEKHKYILSQLEDISSTQDLNDPRIEVFCQPVLNTATGKFDTAEALMRLRLEETGMVFPDQFIPIAEKYGYIHTLSFIILNKTCMEIRSLMREGYVLKRISVNFSMLDVRLTNFCDSIRRIISDCGIPFDKIAIELTESQNEKEFLIVKEKINELKQSGIKFYLDDYGTGYSNFDRIIALPFDIIKFDRSLVIASGKEAKSETMVSYLAHMFSDMNYSVLYEGVEDDRDEIMCRNMCGRYLQGYKYSKPIPIAELRNYFERA
nr:EAL domain-containing protein [Lachnospiraceae bacterium]